MQVFRPQGNNTVLIEQVWIYFCQASAYNYGLMFRELIYILPDDMSGYIFTLLVKPAGADHNTIGFAGGFNHLKTIMVEKIVNLCTRIPIVVAQFKGSKKENLLY